MQRARRRQREQRGDRQWPERRSDHRHHERIEGHRDATKTNRRDLRRKRPINCVGDLRRSRRRACLSSRG